MTAVGPSPVDEHESSLVVRIGAVGDASEPSRKSAQLHAATIAPSGPNEHNTSMPNRIRVLTMVLTCLAVASAVAPSSLLSQGASPSVANPRRQPNGIEVRMGGRPQWFRTSAKPTLRYELHVTSLESAVLLRRLELKVSTAKPTLGVRDSGVTRAFSGEALAGIVQLAGMRGRPASPVVLREGQRLIVHLDLAFATAPAGAQVVHVLSFERAESAKSGTSAAALTEVEVTIEPWAIDDRKVSTLGPPLRGGPWVAAYDPALERGHRRMVYALDGRARIPARYAIDWFLVDSLGRLGQDNDTASGAEARAPDRLIDFFGYGAPVLAVADGVIEVAHDGVEEPDRASSIVPVDAASAAGNYIVLRIGPRRYAIYEHLRPGLRVRKGQHVRSGETIAFVGLSGQARVPHLHFHMADAPSPLAAEGIPYVFTSFRVSGRYESLESFGRGDRWQPVQVGDGRCTPTIQHSVPAANEVVVFGRPPGKFATCD